MNLNLHVSDVSDVMLLIRIDFLSAKQNVFLLKKMPFLIFDNRLLYILTQFGKY